MAAALVMARAPVAGACKTRLEPLLGPEGCARLQAVLIDVAMAWAAEAVGPGRVLLALDGAAGWGHTPACVAQPAGSLGERITAGVTEAFARFGGPLLVIGTDMPRLGRAHAAAALADMDAGADASFGPALDGGYYLLALREPRAELLALAPQDWGGPTVLAKTLRIAAELELDIGLLRTERDLDTPVDAAAFLADPLTPVAVRAALEP